MVRANNDAFNLAKVGNQLHPSYNLSYDGLINSLADLMLSSFLQVSSLCFYVERIEIGIHEKRANLSVLSRLVNQVQSGIQSSIFSTAGYINDSISVLQTGENSQIRSNLKKLQHGFDYSLLGEELSLLERPALLDYCISSFQIATTSLLSRRSMQQQPSNDSFKKIVIPELSIENLDTILKSKPYSPLETNIEDSRKQSIRFFKKESISMAIRRNASPKIKNFEGLKRFESDRLLPKDNDAYEVNDPQLSTNAKLDGSYDNNRQNDRPIYRIDDFEKPIKNKYFDEVINRARRSVQAVPLGRKATTSIRERGLRQTVAEISSSSRLRDRKIFSNLNHTNIDNSVKTSIRVEKGPTMRVINSRDLLKYISLDENMNNEVTIYSKKGSIVEKSNKSLRTDSLRYMNETSTSKERIRDPSSNFNEVKSTFMKLNNTLNELADRMSQPSLSPEPIKKSAQTISLMGKVSSVLQKHKVMSSPVKTESPSFKWISKLSLIQHIATDYATIES
jgi:hypothetical protein